MPKAKKNAKSSTVKVSLKSAKPKSSVKAKPAVEAKAKVKLAKPAEKPAKPAVLKPALKTKAEKAPEVVVQAVEAQPAVKVSIKGAKPKRVSKAKEAMLAEKAGMMSQKWLSLFKKSQEVQAKPYNLRQTFEAKTPIMHKVLGWGYILTNKNDRLEVLFKDGIRFLISNYKA